MLSQYSQAEHIMESKHAYRPKDPLNTGRKHRKTTMIEPALQTRTVLTALLVSSFYTNLGNAETLFDTLVPSKCVTPLLGPAGFCVLQNGCAERCFGRNTRNDPTSTFNLESEGLANFYIPVDAVECSEFEDPICPATDCCPSCKDEIDELYRCIILEGNHHYIDPLAIMCPLDCAPPTPSPVRSPSNPRPSVGRPATPGTVPGKVPGTVPATGPATGPATNPGITPQTTAGPTPATVPRPISILTPQPTEAPTRTPVRHTAPDWVIPEVIGQPYPTMTVTAGDAITFRWSRGTHNVWIYPSGTCDPSGGVEIGSINDNPTTYVFGENLAGSTVTFACEVGSHCDAGMLMNVTVLAPPPPVVPDESIPSSNMTDSDFDDIEDMLFPGSNSTDEDIDDIEDIIGEDVVEEIDVIETDLEKDVVVLVSTPDGVMMVDDRHNTSTFVSDPLP